MAILQPTHFPSTQVRVNGNCGSCPNAVPSRQSAIHITRDLPKRDCLPPQITINSVMLDSDIQIVYNETGEPTAVIIPIELWREIASERETAYLLKSETMKQRLLAAAHRQGGLSLEAVVEQLGI